MKSVLNGISTIIFDLGGVVLNLNPDLTANEFANLSGLTKEEVYKVFHESPWAPAFEKGEISVADFRNNIRRELRLEINDSAIDLAWSAMLRELPEERLLMLSKLHNDYQTMVLSNTNEIHVRDFDKKVAAITPGKTIQDHFHRVYYSHEIGMRKPDLEIYKFILEKNNLKPESTIFVDDMLPNIEAAQQCGIKTIHLTDQKDLFRIFQ